MNLKEKKVMVSMLVAVSILIVSLSGYWIFNKDQVRLVVKGKETKVSTFKNTVKDLLEENGIKYDAGDKITPSLDSKVKDYMEVKVVDVTKEKIYEYEEIPFEVKLIEDNTLLKGKSKVKQEGKEGKRETVYELTYEDGKLVEKNLVKREISEEVVDKIVKKGIKQEYIVASRGNSSRNKTQSNNSNSVNQVESNNQAGGRHMSVVATAYSGDGITSTGTVPRWGTIAVDPRVIPYGTRVYIPQFGMTFVAEDCGGAIKGNKIDIFMGSSSQAYSWGRRTIDIYIVN